MIPLRRMAVVLLAGLLVLLVLGSDSALSAEEKTTAEADGPLGLTIDPRAGLQLAAAADYVVEEDWKNAVRLLQHLLDDKSQSLARVAGRQGKADRYVSVHTEAERLLAEMPQAGREVYQRTVGPRAAELLEQARKERDAELLAAIVRRYLYTEIGPSALEELARRHYRAGRLHFAAYSYARLVEHLGLARWTSDDLYRATVAFQQRSTSTYADRALAQLLARSRQNVVRLGERALTVEQLRTEIERAIPSRLAGLARPRRRCRPHGPRLRRRSVPGTDLASVDDLGGNRWESRSRPRSAPPASRETLAGPPSADCPRVLAHHGHVH
ncbi:MAG TPA: hypothetical protein VH643_37010 [Gemmataceae bacterium]|jgi:hypothetical protein